MPTVISAHNVNPTAVQHGGCRAPQAVLRQARAFVPLQFARIEDPHIRIVLLGRVSAEPTRGNENTGAISDALHMVHLGGHPRPLCPSAGAGIENANISGTTTADQIALPINHDEASLMSYLWSSGGGIINIDPTSTHIAPIVSDRAFICPAGVGAKYARRAYLIAMAGTAVDAGGATLGATAGKGATAGAAACTAL